MECYPAFRASVIGLACSLTAWAATPSTAHASNLISWGATTALVTSTQTSPRWVEITAESPTLPLHLGIPLTPVNRYAGPSIYGGIKATGKLHPTAFRFFNNHPVFGGGNDVIDIRNEDSDPSAAGRVTTLLLWRNEAPASTEGERYLAQLSYTGGYSSNSVSEAFFVVRVIDSADPQPSYAYLISPVSVSGIFAASHALDATQIPWFRYEPGEQGETLDSIPDLSRMPPALRQAFIPVSRVTHAGLLFRGSGRPKSSVLAVSAFAAEHVPAPPSAPVPAP